MIRLLRGLTIFCMVVVGYVLALPITICRIAYLLSNIFLDDIFEVEKKEIKENENGQQ